MEKKVSDKVLKKLFALKELAERGERGEKQKAGALLNNLLFKHGMTLDDLEIEDLKWQEFKVKIFQRNFFSYIVDNVLGTAWEQYQHQEKKEITYVFCSNLDAIEIEGKFEFYWRVFQRDIPAFMQAFIRANQLFPKDPKVVDFDTMDEEKRKEMLKLFKLQQLATKAEYRKQLSKADDQNELKQ